MTRTGLGHCGGSQPSTSEGASSVALRAQSTSKDQFINFFRNVGAQGRISILLLVGRGCPAAGILAARLRYFERGHVRCRVTASEDGRRAYARNVRNIRKSSPTECLSLKRICVRTTRLKSMKKLILSLAFFGVSLSGFAPQANAYCYYRYHYRYYYYYNPVTGRYYYLYRWWYGY